MMNASNELELVGINKAFGGKPIYQNFSYRFQEGIHAILGVNGSGKSTLISLMTGIDNYDAGEVYINGINLQDNPPKAKSFLGYVPDKPEIYPFITGQDFLELISSMKRTSIPEDLLDLFSLQEMRLKKFQDMSLGTQKKFFIVAGVLGNPGIIILDEPTNGLDPKSINVLTNELLKRCQAGAVVIFSSHNLSFVNAMEADKCYLINKVNSCFSQFS